MIIQWRKYEWLKSNGKHKIIKMQTTIYIQLFMYSFKLERMRDMLKKLFARIKRLERIIAQVLLLFRQFPVKLTTVPLLDGYEKRLGRCKKIAAEVRHLQYNTSRDKTVGGGGRWYWGLSTSWTSSFITCLRFCSSSQSLSWYRNICKQQTVGATWLRSTAVWNALPTPK